MAGFSQFLQTQQQPQRQPAPTHGSALMALLGAALRARQQPQIPAPPVLMAAPPADPEYARGYQLGLQIARQRGPFNG